MPDTIDFYESDSGEDRNVEEIVGGSSSGQGQFPYQVSLQTGHGAAGTGLDLDWEYPADRMGDEEVLPQELDLIL